MIDQQVSRQTRQPYRERSFPRTETLQILEHPDEYILRQILRFGVAIGEPVTDGVHSPGMQLYQVLPGGVVAPQASLNEIDVCIQTDGLRLRRLSPPFCFRNCRR